MFRFISCMITLYLHNSIPLCKRVLELLFWDVTHRKVKKKIQNRMSKTNRLPLPRNSPLSYFKLQLFCQLQVRLRLNYK